MRLAVTSIAIISLTAHAVLGCCWSHWVVDQGEGRQYSSAALVKPDQDHRHDSQPRHSHLPGDCDGECGGNCNYLLASNAECPKATSFVLLLLNFRDLQCDADLEGRRIGEIRRPGDFIALPLRPHLLHQVLLV